MSGYKLGTAGSNLAISGYKADMLAMSEVQDTISHLWELSPCIYR